MYPGGSNLNWTTHGLLHMPNPAWWWSQSHAQCPVPDSQAISPGLYRIYYSTRDSAGKSRIGSCLLNTQLMQIVQSQSEPELDLGTLGSFDDAGVMPAAVIVHNNKKYLFYIGWMERKSVPYQNAIGLAEIDEAGRLSRVFEGPVLSAWADEAYFTGTINIFAKDNRYLGYYLCCTEWFLSNGKPEPRYDIRVASTSDLIHWKRTGKSALALTSGTEGGYASASVIQLNDRYLMFYCKRNAENYRMTPENSYKIYAAVSADAETWVKIPDFQYSETTEFDNSMQCYPQLLRIDNRVYMFYNGNDFGKKGFGCSSIDIHELEELCGTFNLN